MKAIIEGVVFSVLPMMGSSNPKPLRTARMMIESKTIAATTSPGFFIENLLWECASAEGTERIITGKG